jgi:DNA modification methylase
MQNSFRNVGMSQVAKRVTLIEGASVEELSQILQRKKSVDVVVIDSLQYSQLTYRQYIYFKEKHKNKLLIFVSHADGKQPAGRAAKSIMYDATLKIWVEGYKAFSKGRYIGSTGEYVIWPEGAIKYYGSL